MADEAKAPKEAAKKAAPAKAEPAGDAPKKVIKKVAKEEAPKKAAAPLEERDDAEEEEGARQGEETPEAAPAKAQKAKAAPKAAAKDDDDDEEEAAPKRSKRPRPALAPEVSRALKIRTQKSRDRPNFYRQEWFRYQRLGEKWRFPQGIQSKMRRHWGTHADVVSIGHRGPAAARGLHPSGFREVLVHNADGLAKIDPKKEAVRIAGSVGWQNRDTIQKKARKLGIRVLNWKEGKKR